MTMDFLISLFRTDSAAHAVLILSMVSLGGLVLGQFRLFRINLGIAGVLFAGLAAGFFHLTLNDAVLDFSRDFGLILFVYAIGMQVGPGFFANFRRHGLPLNIVASLIVLFGVLITLAIMRFAHVPCPDRRGSLHRRPSPMPQVWGQHSRFLKMCRVLRKTR